MTPSNAHPVIGVIGATGAVGREMLTILAERGVAAERIRCFASERSVGRELEFGDRSRSLVVEALHPDVFADLQVALLAVDAEQARDLAPTARDAGCVVIDNSSAFRNDPDVPLVIPEVNGEELAGFGTSGIIANPNCSTIIALMAIAPIHHAVGIRRVSVATYQAVSGAGAAAMDELERQARDHVAGRPILSEALPSPAFFNVFPHESPLDADGFNGEERKLRDEGRRILDAPGIEIAATCVRVGVPRCHAMAIELDLEAGLDVNRARALLSDRPGVRVVEAPESRHAAGGDDVLVGRLRNHPDRPDNTGLLLFVVGDQLRKGAALNAIQILSELPGFRVDDP